MRGIICYYSTTGNTDLACKYIADNIHDIEFEFCDIKTNQIQSFDAYDIVGFATYTDWWDIPYIFEKYISDMPDHPGKHAFIFNTYAQLSGKTLKTLSELIRKKGFNIVCAYSLRTPGNYPPSLAKGRTFDDAPTKKELEGFNKFISELSQQVRNLLDHRDILQARVKIGLLNSILRRYPRIQAKQLMGELYVDEQLCIKCGMCKNLCAYKAIQLTPIPVFDNSKCYGCWACFNRCPQKAIYSREIRGIGHYSGPSKKLREKLGYNKDTDL
jgi:ferredoxin/flavodoxin